MGKAKLEVPFSEITGRLDRESETYCATRLGETVVSHYPKHKDPKKITAPQRAQQSAFQQAVQQAKEILQDPIQRQHWQTLFDQQRSPRQYKTLRGFIIGTLTKNI